MLIGFTSKTSKLLPKLLCRKFRHCAIIWMMDDGRWMMEQFVKRNHIEKIYLYERDLKILEQHGWLFISIMPAPSSIILHPSSFTCVSFAKRALGIRKPFIWTPDQLYRYLKRPDGAFLVWKV